MQNLDLFFILSLIEKIFSNFFRARLLTGSSTYKTKKESLALFDFFNWRGSGNYLVFRLASSALRFLPSPYVGHGGKPSALAPPNQWEGVSVVRNAAP